MSAERPNHEQDLSPLERRLQNWQPAASGSSRERMLFEAGRAAARRSRIGMAQVGFAGFLVSSVLLAGGWMVERAKRQRLAQQLAEVQLDRHRESLPRLPEERVDTEVRLALVDRPDPVSYLVLTRGIGSAGETRERAPETRAVPERIPVNPARDSLRAGDRLTIEL